MTNFTTLILAAQRPGVINPLAQGAGVSHKCIVPICGMPLIHHVVASVAATAGATHIRICVEPELWPAIDRIVAPFRRADLNIDTVAAARSLADSVVEGLNGLAGPYVITTADNVLLTPDATLTLVSTLRDAEVAAVLTTREAVQAVDMEAQRRFYRMGPGHYSNCNLYGIRDARALGAAEIFRQGGQFRRNIRRAINAFGLLNIVMAVSGMLSIDAAARRLSRRFGITFATPVMSDGALAIDVDNERTYRIAYRVLEARLKAAAPPPSRLSRAA